MKIFISAPKDKKFFIECVEAVAKARNDEWIYCPDRFRKLKDLQLLKEVMRELTDAHIVLMDLSMKKFGDEWYPNSGVMIEFGLLMKDTTKGLGFVYMFCDDKTKRDNLPPMVPRVKVQQYSENHPEALKQMVSKALEEFLRESPERERKLLEVYGATTTLVKQQIVYGNP